MIKKKYDNTELIKNIIYTGQCEKYLSDKKLFIDNSIDLIITSPPYAEKRKKYYGSIPAQNYVKWFIPIGFELLRILKTSGSFILNIKEHPINGERDTYVIELILELKKMGWHWIEEYCWYKKNSFPGKWKNRFRDSWERCLHFTKSNEFKMYQNSVKVPIGDWAEKRFKSMSKEDFLRHMSSTNKSLGRNVSNWINRKKVFPHNVIVFEEEHYVTNVIEMATVCNNKNHSATFPLELPTWFIKLFTRRGDVIMDPFCGSGTSLYAAFALNREYIGIESSEVFVENIKMTLNKLKE